MASHTATDEELESIHNGDLELIDDIGDGHRVTIPELHEDSDSVALMFHADDGREIKTAIAKDDVRLHHGQAARNFGADAILVTPVHVNGDNEKAQNIYNREMS